MKICHAYLLIVMLMLSVCIRAQVAAPQRGNVPISPDSLAAQSISSNYLDAVSSKVGNLDRKLEKKTSRTLKKMKVEELRLMKKLSLVDSVAAVELFSGVQQKYSDLQNKLASPGSHLNQSDLNYIPCLDTLKNVLQFLSRGNQHLTGQSGVKQLKLKDAVTKVNGFDVKMNQSQAIQQYLKERRQYLKEQLSRFGLDRHMKKMSKTVYYYSQSIKEYKEILKDNKKAETKALTLLSKMPAFKKFMQNNSQFSSMFGVPSGNAGSSSASFAGLQTRVSVQQLLQSSPVSSSNSQQFLIQQLQAASEQFSQQKNAIHLPALQDNLGEMPDFKPNQQKTKSFLKRLEYGANVQFGKTNQLLPVTSELAFSLGYRINDAGVLGIGSSYKLGLGSGIRHIRFTQQGFGIRSYIDWKIKGGFYVSGGFEKNYLPQLNDVVAVQKTEAWQESGLIGISKKYPLSKKRKGFVQVLFDFLSYKNLPRSQPILFRTGINF